MDNSSSGQIPVATPAAYGSSANVPVAPIYTPNGANVQQQQYYPPQQQQQQQQYYPQQQQPQPQQQYQPPQPGYQQAAYQPQYVQQQQNAVPVGYTGMPIGVSYPSTVGVSIGGVGGVTMTGGTTVVTVGSVALFDRNPTTCTCPNCRNNIVTNVTYESGTLMWAMVLILCCIGCWPFCLIPFCMPNLKDAVHTCPRCSYLVSRRSGF